MSLLLLIVMCLAVGLFWKQIWRLRERVEMLKSSILALTIAASAKLPPTVYIEPVFTVARRS